MVPHPVGVVHVGLGGPVLNLVVGGFLFAGQSILMRPKRSKQGRVGTGGSLNGGSVGQGSAGGVGLGTLEH